jgi:hypothetical protein
MLARRLSGPISRKVTLLTLRFGLDLEPFDHFQCRAEECRKKFRDCTRSILGVTAVADGIVVLISALRPSAFVQPKNSPFRLGHQHFMLSTGAGSEARIVTGLDEAAIIRLAQEKRGDIEPEDILQQAHRLLGVATEASLSAGLPEAHPGSLLRGADELDAGGLERPLKVNQGLRAAGRDSVMLFETLDGLSRNADVRCSFSCGPS